MVSVDMCWIERHGRKAWKSAEVELLGPVVSAELDERYGKMGEAEAAERVRHWRSVAEQKQEEWYEMMEEDYW